MKNDATSLTKKKVFIALISGGTYGNIEKTLERLGISDFFKLIITGDVIKHSKPSPEIYNLLKSKVSERLFITVEDSYNGLLSAKEASIDAVIYYNNLRQGEPRNDSIADYSIKHFNEIPAIIYATERLSFSMEKLSCSENLSFNNCTVDFDDDLERSLDELWAEDLTKNSKLFNGRIVCYQSMEKTHDSININIFCTDYKHFRYREHIYSETGIKITPIAVSGIIMDENGNVLMGTRSNVSQYDGWTELIPSGGLQFNEYGKMNSPDEQIMIELTEETALCKNYIHDIEAFCLLYDGKGTVYDIGYRILIKNELQALLDSGIIKSEEYTNIKVIKLHDLLSDFNKHCLLSTSVCLASHAISRYI